eukprot:11251179-Alexandrium_andersonii.AAC.1
MERARHGAGASWSGRAFTGPSRATSEGSRRLRMGELRIGALRAGDFSTSDPLESRFHAQIWNLCERLRKTHLSGASWATFEAFLGPRSSRCPPLTPYCVAGEADRGWHAAPLQAASWLAA